MKVKKAGGNNQVKTLALLPRLLPRHVSRITYTFKPLSVSQGMYRSITPWSTLTEF